MGSSIIRDASNIDTVLKAVWTLTTEEFQATWPVRSNQKLSFFQSYNKMKYQLSVFLLDQIIKTDNKFWSTILC
jgi:hypothetical protein